MDILLPPLRIFNTSRVVLRVSSNSRLPQDVDLWLKQAEGFMFMYSL
jgi:hypothetical protein